MSITMYQTSVPGFVRALTNLDAVLAKGAAHAESKKVADEVMLQTRLTPDMLPLVKQVQIACDMCARAAARLAGAEPQNFADTETTFAQLHERVAAAIAYVKTFTPAQIDGSEAREIELKTANGSLHFKGQDYLLGFALPNIYFHCSTAYAILRQVGVEIGKNDFIGKP
jgi:uncharacterized protein